MAADPQRLEELKGLLAKISAAKNKLDEVRIYKLAQEVAVYGADADFWLTGSEGGKKYGGMLSRARKNIERANKALETADQQLFEASNVLDEVLLDFS